MTDHERLRQIFDAVLAAAPERRSEIAARECGDDEPLRQRVMRMVAASEKDDPFLARPSHAGVTPSATVESPGSEVFEERSGAEIDRFKLLEQIGEGGMGTVWMAEQREPVKRRVALKIVKLGMDTKQVIARFEAERQALAMMDHPNIAKVFDAGATRSGRPYFVMEYIRGIPIVEYCDKERLDTRTRLELFAKVCNAIQHAHNKGIIHRDIKPSNVLVTLHDGVPVPKVIDFGIAKATNTELTAKTLFTEHAQMVGTPAYMSPEQAEMSGLDIDTRSDVYSLGVLLYELLTGTTPFDIRTLLSQGYSEMMRAIREVEPHKPSTRISSLGDKGTRTAQLRNVELKRLSAILRGDVDWIVMKCLEKDRRRRYETANGLADDIARHLMGDAVIAAPPSTAYKLRKFVRRNRVAVTAVGAVAVALVIGAVAFAWHASEAREQRDLALAAKNSEAEQRKLAEAAKLEAQAHQARAEEQEAEAQKQAALAKQQEEEARQQAAIAEAVAKFQTDMLAAVDPNLLPIDPVTKEPLRDALTVVQAMAAAVDVLDAGSLADQPLVEARVRATIGKTLDALGRYDQAEPSLRKTVELCRAALPAGHPDIATALNNLAMLLARRNELAEAERLHREALSIHRATLPAGDSAIAASLNNLALLLSEQNRVDEAEPLYREALEIDRALHPDGHANVASTLSNFGTLLSRQNRSAEAEALLRESLEMARASLPAGHPQVSVSLNCLASELFGQGEFAEAESLFRESLAIARATLPAAHPNLGRALGSLAMVLGVQNELAEAEPLYREALEITRAAFPAGHPDIASGLGALAELLRRQDEYAEAESLNREALGIARMALPAGHPDLVPVLSNLARVLANQNEFTEAETLLREALEIRRAAFPAGHPLIASGLNNLAQLLRMQNKVAEAEPLLREALEMERAALPSGHPQIASSLANLADLLAERNELAEAETLYREALAIRLAVFPPGHPDIAVIQIGLAQLLQAKNEFAEAEQLFRDALEICRAVLPPGHSAIVLVVASLADIFAAVGRADEALPLIREFIDADRDAQPADSPELAGRLAFFGEKCLALNEWDGAETLLRECLETREKTEPDEWTTFSTRSMLGEARLGQNELAEAEPLLLDGYRGMREREAEIPEEARGRVTHALERLVKLYEAKGDEAQAAEWRNALEAARSSNSAPSEGQGK